jgi:hypothetical protein
MNILEDDQTGEIKLVNNNWFMVTGTSEIMQAIKQNLETVLGEVWLDTSIGVPRRLFIGNRSAESHDYRGVSGLHGRGNPGFQSDLNARRSIV